MFWKPTFCLTAESRSLWQVWWEVFSVVTDRAMYFNSDALSSVPRVHWKRQLFHTYVLVKFSCAHRCFFSCPFPSFLGNVLFSSPGNKHCFCTQLPRFSRKWTIFFFKVLVKSHQVAILDLLFHKLKYLVHPREPESFLQAGKGKHLSGSSILFS